MVSLGDCNIPGEGIIWIIKIPWGRGNFDRRMMPLVDLRSFSHEKSTLPTGCGSLFRHRYAENPWGKPSDMICIRWTFPTPMEQERLRNNSQWKMQPATREFQPGTGKVIHWWIFMDRIVGEISGYTAPEFYILPQVNSHSYFFLLQSISHGARSQMPADEDETWPDGSAASVIDMAPSGKADLIANDSNVSGLETTIWLFNIANWKITIFNR